MSTTVLVLDPPNREDSLGRGEAKANVNTKAKLKVEAKVKDNDLATGNALAGG